MAVDEDDAYGDESERCEDVRQSKSSEKREGGGSL